MKLYEIEQAIREFEENNVDPETGEILNLDQLDELYMAKDAKIEGIGVLIKECKAESEAIKAEIDNLRHRLERCNNRMESLLNYMKHALNGENFETTKVQARWRRSEQVQILDENVIPDKFVNVQTVRKPVKDLIKKAIKSGEEVTGAILAENRNLTVK